MRDVPIARTFGTTASWPIGCEPTVSSAPARSWASAISRCLHSTTGLSQTAALTAGKASFTSSAQSNRNSGRPRTRTLHDAKASLQPAPSARSTARLVPSLYARVSVNSFTLTLVDSLRTNRQSQASARHRWPPPSCITPPSPTPAALPRTNQRPCEGGRLSPTTLFPKS